MSINIDFLRTWVGKENSVADDLNPFPACAGSGVGSHIFAGEGRRAAAFDTAIK